MSKHALHLCLVISILLIPIAITANDDLPEILASINPSNIQEPYDSFLESIRGEAKWIMVSSNYGDYYSGKNAINTNVDKCSTCNTGWTSNPLKWRYGKWGGRGWSNDGNLVTASSWTGTSNFVDEMDKIFRKHDKAYNDANGKINLIATADSTLVKDLKALENSSWDKWGSAYNSSKSTNAGAPEYVTVKVFVPKGTGNLITGYTTLEPIWIKIPFSEYARTQAITAFEVKTVLNRTFQISRSILSGR